MLSKKRLIMLATILTLGLTALPVHASEIADQNPPDVTEDSYLPFHPDLNEDMAIIETEADKEEENQTTFDEVILNETTFPDTDFRNFVASKCDTNNDGTLQSDEIRAAKILDTEFEAYFSSTQGIEYLKNLKKFAAPMAGITDIDVSQNPKLQILDLNYNEELDTIDVSSNANLRILDISTTKISNVDVSQNPDLKWLYCYDSQIDSIDVSHNSKLKRLDLARTAISNIDISNNPKLQALNIEETNVSSINTSQNRDLYEFYFKDTTISQVDFSKNWNLAQVWASGTKLTSLDVSHCRNLFVLYVQNLAIKEIDFTNCPNLYELFASNSALEKLDMANHTNLNCIEIDGTNISKLDIRKSPNIHGLSVSGSKITELDLTKNKKLKRLELKDTTITQLDISQNTELEKLYFDNTAISNLKTLDLSGYPKLQELGCSNSGIETLILPESPDLCYLNCANNHLKQLDLSNAPMLWYDLKHSPQTITVSGLLENGKVVVNLKQIISDISKVTVLPSEHYTYDAETGLLAFTDTKNLEFSYSYMHGYQYAETDTPLSVQAKVSLTYKILEGINQKISIDNTLSFKCEGSKKDFLSLSVNGTELSADDYTIKEMDRTLVFEIGKDFINNLPVGKHIVTITYTNGKASFTFEKIEKVITPPTEEKDPAKNPPALADKEETPKHNTSDSIETGDSTPIIPWVALSAISLFVLCTILIKKVLYR